VSVPQVETGLLERSILEGVDRAARRGRKTVVSVVLPIECDDPAAVAFISRRAGDHWFCWERGETGTAIGAIGTAEAVVSRGPDRFRDVASECAHLSGEAVVVDPYGVSPRSGPLWCGGFAFSDGGAGTSIWSSFPPARMALPEIQVEAGQDTALLTLNLVVTAGIDRASAVEAAVARASGLKQGELPLLDPHPSVRPTIESALPPDRFEESVGIAVDAIRRGDLEKVVLAREIVVQAASAHDPAALFGAIREGFPTCFNFCVGTPEAAFVGASPELLIRSEGRTVSTVALAGSTRRSADPAVDDHLAERLLASDKDRGEQQMVVRQITESLRRLSVWVESAPEPEIVKVANIQHLGTPIIAQLAQPLTAIELAGLLHPTPAVGGKPWKQASKVIAEVEGMDRGWYAGPVGWMEGSGDGEFCVALRSALLRDRSAHLYAGVGVVADSSPPDELAETEIKLGALLPLLAE
jgi:salicylate biosynthesis isochorismate synthase/menaquinone-specific isochorismate synthase